MVVVLVGLAFAVAQDRLVEDFEPPALTWTDHSGVHEDTGISKGWFDIWTVSLDDGRGDVGSCFAYGGRLGECIVESSYFLVTHETFSFEASLYGDSVWDATVEVADQQWRWQRDADWAVLEADTSGLCGTLTNMSVVNQGWGTDLYLDNLKFSGPVCAIYRDQDGDGNCPEGVDRDGDGVCLDDEITYDVQDCDDLDPRDGCLELTASTPVPGASMDLEVRGVEPDELVRIGISPVAGERCYDALGGACLGLVVSKGAYRKVRADQDGVARASIPVPAALPVGHVVYAQAAIQRGVNGEDSVVTDLWVGYAE